MPLLPTDRALSGTRTPGPERRTLSVGPWSVAFEGLDPETALRLDRRWGGFVGPEEAEDVSAAARLLDAGPGSFLEAAPGEGYRFEATGAEVVSYHFAARRGEGERWRVAVAASEDEPRERTLDNLARLLVARLALRSGGLALHGAGVLLAGNAFVFAGPSRAGKSTAARLARADASLGDDFAVVVPRDDGYAAVAVPFDNSERGPAVARVAPSPLAGIFRLEKSADARIEPLAGAAAIASLVGCAAFPWALPDLAGGLLPVAEAVVGAGLFSVLRFGPATDVRALIDLDRSPQW